MHIDSYKFGQIVIDGAKYSSDCLIIAGAVKADWWRQQGHSLSVEDLQEVIEGRPAVLVIGCGVSSMMSVPERVVSVLKEHDIEVEISNTKTAVDRFNELLAAGVNAAGAFHLTC